jgi:uncharacterized protein (DUF427 family)
MDGNHAKHNPDHRVELRPGPGRVRVTFAGETIADSRYAVTVHETNHDPVHYLPRRDVRMDRLARTSRTTHCPYKGDASYFSLKAGDRTAENAVWTYETPFDEVIGIKEMVAFYTDRVDAIEVE